GLQVPDTPFLDTVEEMAAHYAAAMRGVQPHGPYLLGGWSIGGTVAFELARQLAAAGEEVALLVLVDPPPPFQFGARQPDELEMISLFARDLAATQGRDLLVTMSVAELRALAPAERLPRVLAEAEVAHLVPPGIGAAAAERLFHMYRTTREAARVYVPGPYPGSAVVFLTTDPADPAGAAGDGAADDGSGWPELAAGGVEVEEIAGDHYSILRPPGVEALAARLAARLAPFDGRRSEP
ncbi:MAG TPA: thioesterase domain-containing protein, partial [Thermoanaerobaculia bacterium]|nr:thioesterase domain-containing protein [Thermoanaerobaculia bacterium]